MVQNDIKGGGVGAGWEHRSPSPSPPPPPKIPSTQCAEAQGVVNATNVITKVQKLLTVANL
jgi:hypothetical protein